jgi:hypothetical protein
MPFTNFDDNEPARLLLEPIDAHEFAIVQGFKYVARVSGEKFVVGRDAGYRPPPGRVPVSEDNETTDFASVPFFLQWFIRSYGRHTLAAILHDHLWRKHPVDKPLDSAAFKASNTVFREAMHELRVPFFRRWVMWSAVSLASFARRPGLWRARVIAWVAAVVGLDVITVLALVRDPGVPAKVTAIAMLVAALVLLWPHRVVTTIGVPAIYLLTPAILVVLATVAVFYLLDLVGSAVGHLRHRLAPSSPAPLSPSIPKREHPKATEELVIIPAEEGQTSIR